MIDVGAGRVDIMFNAVPSLLALIQAGKLRPLAAASAERNPIVPDVPTFGELGIKGMEVSLWYGLVETAGPAAADRAAAQHRVSENSQVGRGERKLRQAGRNPSGRLAARTTPISCATSPRRWARSCGRTESSWNSTLARLPVIHGVRPHVGGRRHAVAHVVEARDRGNIPDVAFGEARLT